MKKLLTLITLPALALVAACNNEPEEIGGGPVDPMAEQLANAGPVELPPMVAQSKTFRCKDNSLIFVDYMNDNKTAHLRIEKKESAPTILTSEEPGKPFVAEGGYSVTGPGDVIEASLPGKGSQSCKA